MWTLIWVLVYGLKKKRRVFTSTDLEPGDLEDAAKDLTKMLDDDGIILQDTQNGLIQNNNVLNDKHHVRYYGQ